MRKYEQMSRFRPMYATILASLALLLTAAWGAATPAQADDQSDYTVTVDAGVTPTTIAPGQTASGTPGAGIVGNNATATSELPSTIPNPVFSVDSTVGVNGGDTAPSAGIDSNGNLNVTAGNSTTPDVYTVTVRATYTWTDAAGTTHKPYGTTDVSVAVSSPALNILGASYVQIGKTVAANISVANPLPGGCSFPATLSVTPSGGGSATISPSSVTIPGDGTPVKVQVSGTGVSTAVGDVILNVSGIANVSSCKITIFDLSSSCTATPSTPQGYVFIPSDGHGVGSFETSAKYAITVVALVKAIPDGAEPPDVQCGLVQNETSSNRSLTYGNPILKLANPLSTRSVLVPATLVQSWSIPPAVDGLTDNFWNSYYAGPVEVNDLAIGYDTPAMEAEDSVALPVVDATVGWIGTVLYRLVSASAIDTFGDWCAQIDPANGGPTYPASTGWSLNLSVPNPVGIAVGGGGGSPILANGQTPNANALGTSAQNNASYSPVGSVSLFNSPG